MANGKPRIAFIGFGEAGQAIAAGLREADVETMSAWDILFRQAAGEKLNEMPSLGASKPWPDALEALTGQRELDASALADYFAPLKTWLDAQNKKNNYPIGW